MVPFLFREAEQVKVIAAAGSGVGLWFEIAPTSAEENIHDWTKGVAVSNLLCGDGLIGVAVGNVCGIDSGGCMVDSRGNYQSGLVTCKFGCLKN